MKIMEKGGLQMIHESDKKNDLLISDSDLNFEKIYSKPYFPKEHEEDLKKANLLLIPNEGYGGLDGPVFPEQTMEFYNFLRNYENKELVGDICISDENYVELELHEELITLANLVVVSGILPIALNLISSYLDRKIQRRKKSIKLKVNITVVEGDKSKSISYEGDAEKFEETIKAASDVLFK